MKYLCPNHAEALRNDSPAMSRLRYLALENGKEALEHKEIDSARRLLGTAFELNLLLLAAHPTICWQDVHQLTQIADKFLLTLQTSDDQDEVERCILVTHRAVLEAIHAPAEGSSKLPLLLDLLENTLNQALAHLNQQGKHAHAQHLQLTTRMLEQQAISARAH